MDDPFRRTSLGAAVFYRNPMVALDWLENAFGFRRVMVITDKDGNLAHAEMRFRDGYLMVGSEWAEYTTSPASIGGKNTQSVHVHLQDGLDEHCEHARAAGAQIMREPEDQFYGDRVYVARDLEGHVWSFGQSVRKVSREDAELASGLNIKGWWE